MYYGHVGIMLVLLCELVRKKFFQRYLIYIQERKGLILIYDVIKTAELS